MAAIPDDRGSLGETLRLSTVGLTLALCVGIGAGLGVWADSRLGTDPVLTVVGFFLGVAAGFVELLRATRSR